MRIIIIIFGALVLISGILEGIYKNIKLINGILMMVFGAIMIVSGIFYNIYLLILGLLGSHIISIINNYQMYKSVNKKYHIYRFLISIFLIFGVFFYK